MAAESIYALRKPGFPKESFDESGYNVTIEYVGLDSTLRAAMPAIGQEWGDHDGLVVSRNIDPDPGSTYSTLTVVCGYKYDTTGSATTPGTKLVNETSYELEWTDVQRPLTEHPIFAAGGYRALSDTEKINLESWKAMDNPDYKASFYYYTHTPEEGLVDELTTNAKYMAKGILLGIEYWVDKVPIARRTDTYINGPPPAGRAGEKEEPPDFPSLPDGYEWIRDADRALRAGGQNTWSNETSWIGAKKVLIDAAEIYWTI